MNILCAIGARPNFVKVSRLKEAFEGHDFRFVHMGQHTSDEMSGVFLRQLEIKPDYYDIEKAFDFNPDLLIVVGDVNSARDACIYGKRKGVKIAHIESGLRSFNNSMPEEINRMLIDQMADIHFVTEESGLRNLYREGKDGYIVGNTMIDTAMYYAEKIKRAKATPKDYILFTAHRPSNVDGEAIKNIDRILSDLTKKYTVVFPVHPRTKIGQTDAILLPPLDYFSFHKLVKNASLVVTDSGGLQEESSFYGVPCLTIRNDTERPVTVTHGTNWVVGTGDIMPFVEERFGIFEKEEIPYWDGNACKRIAQKVIEIFNL